MWKNQTLYRKTKRLHCQYIRSCSIEFSFYSDFHQLIMLQFFRERTKHRWRESKIIIKPLARHSNFNEKLCTQRI